MFKRKQNGNINVIYKASEETRRAIDDLYTRKSDRNKAMAASVLISLFVGVGLGMWLQMSHTYGTATDNVVKIEVSEPLKAKPQSEQK